MDETVAKSETEISAGEEHQAHSDVNKLASNNDSLEGDLDLKKTTISSSSSSSSSLPVTNVMESDSHSLEKMNSDEDEDNIHSVVESEIMDSQNLSASITSGSLEHYESRWTPKNILKRTGDWCMARVKGTKNITKARNLSRSVSWYTSAALSILILISHAFFLYGQSEILWDLSLYQNYEHRNHSTNAWENIPLSYEVLESWNYIDLIHELMKKGTFSDVFTAYFLIVFSGFMPHVKLLILHLYYYFPVPAIHRRSVLYWLGTIGKWSHTDICVICVVFLALNVSVQLRKEVINVNREPIFFENEDSKCANTVWFDPFPDYPPTATGLNSGRLAPANRDISDSLSFKDPDLNEFANGLFLTFDNLDGIELILNNFVTKDIYQHGNESYFFSNNENVYEKTDQCEFRNNSVPSMPFFKGDFEDIQRQCAIWFSQESECVQRKCSLYNGMLNRNLTTVYNSIKTTDPVAEIMSTSYSAQARDSFGDPSFGPIEVDPFCVPVDVNNPCGNCCCRKVGDLNAIVELGIAVTPTPAFLSFALAVMTSIFASVVVEAIEEKDSVQRMHGVPSIKHYFKKAGYSDEPVQWLIWSSDEHIVKKIVITILAAFALPITIAGITVNIFNQRIVGLIPQLYLYITRGIYSSISYDINTIQTVVLINDKSVYGWSFSILYAVFLLVAPLMRATVQSILVFAPMTTYWHFRLAYLSNVLGSFVGWEPFMLSSLLTMSEIPALTYDMLSPGECRDVEEAIKPLFYSVEQYNTCFTMYMDLNKMIYVLLSAWLVLVILNSLLWKVVLRKYNPLGHYELGDKGGPYWKPRSFLSCRN